MEKEIYTAPEVETIRMAEESQLMQTSKGIPGHGQGPHGGRAKKRHYYDWSAFEDNPFVEPEDTTVNTFQRFFKQVDLWDD